MVGWRRKDFRKLPEMELSGCEIWPYARVSFAAHAKSQRVLACVIVLVLLSGCSGTDDDVGTRSGELRSRIDRLCNERLQAARKASQVDRWTHAKHGDPVQSKSSEVKLFKEIAESRRLLEKLQSELSNKGGPDTEKNWAENQRVLDDIDMLNVFRFIEGIDDEATFLSKDEAQHDPFFQIALASAPQPGTLQEVLERIAAHEEASSLTRASFLLGEGAQIPVSDSAPLEFNRGFRFVVTWTRTGEAEILLGTPAGARAGFLEVMSWDPTKRAFNYYERINPQEPMWFWKGDSSHALDPQSRGQACFRCHINGSPVMRELKQPWNNWHSEAAEISATVPDEIRRQQPRRTLFRQKKGAQILEAIVNHGIERWDSERVKRSRDGDSIRNVAGWTRQLTTTTSVNLITSQTKSDRRQAVDEEFIDLPLTFFLNVTALRSVLSGTLPTLDTRVRRPHYEAALEKYKFKLFENIPDTFFAFSVPQPSHEDTSAIRALVSNRLVTPKLAASILMVDFPNPIYSTKRQILFRVVSEVTDGQFDSAGTSDIPAQIESAVASSISDRSPTPNTLSEVQGLQPAEQFLFYFRLPKDTWEETVKAHITEYFASIRARLQLAEGVDEYLQLAVSRRAQFAAVAPGSHMILESNILFPDSTLAEMNLDMGVDGRPRQTPPDH